MVQCSVQPSRYKRRKKEEHVHRRTRNTEVERGSKRAEGFYFPQLILGNLQYLETWSVVLDNRKTAILLSFLRSSYLALLVRIKPASHKVPPTGLQLIQLHLANFLFPAINRLRLPFRDFLSPPRPCVSYTTTGIELMIFRARSRRVEDRSARLGNIDLEFYGNIFFLFRSLSVRIIRSIFPILFLSRDNNVVHPFNIPRPECWT